MPEEYVTDAELKAALELEGLDYADADITRAGKAASRAIEKATDRRYWKDEDANQERRYDAPADCVLHIDDLVEVTKLEVDGTELAIDTDYRLEPLNASTDGEPFRSVRRVGASTWGGSLVTITGRFGWPAVPSEINQAAIILATKLMRRTREAPFGVISSGLDGSAVRIAQRDPDLRLLLEPFTDVVVA